MSAERALRAHVHALARALDQQDPAAALFPLEQIAVLLGAGAQLDDELSAILRRCQAEAEATFTRLADSLRGTARTQRAFRAYEDGELLR